LPVSRYGLEGLGKTVVTLTYVKELLDDFAVNRVLVIAPKRVAEDTWTTEKGKWDHLQELRISKVLGSAKQREVALALRADIYVINRENVQWLVEKCGAAWPFDMVVIDELSSFKSSQSKRWRSLKRVIKLSPRVIGLTGTPAGNGYEDLWPEIFLIDGGAALGKTITSYRDNYFYPGARKGHIVYEWKLRAGAKERIDRQLRPFCLSMSKEDWLQLPPVIYNEVRVRMDDSERAEYDRFARDRVLPLLGGELSTIEDMESAVVGNTAAVVSNKLLQLANGAVYDDQGGVFHLHDRKLDALADIIESSQGQPVLVYYAYKHDAQRIKERFPEAITLDCSEDIEQWNKGHIPLLLCHPASAGLGLNLQEGGHIMVWFGLPWSLELLQQAEARLHRQGQRQGVIIHRLVCEDTLDERVLAVLSRKDATQKSLLKALKEYVGDLA
jgi:SNF2 family DNA or RNA helicase